MSTSYISTQIINAAPMTRGEYNIYRGWKLPKNENPIDAGYLVQNLEFNSQSWIPKQQFEASAVELDNLDGLLPYQQRLMGEQAKLNSDLNKLQNAIKKPTFLNIPVIERDYLVSQSRAMTQYLNKLDKRVDLFYPYDSSR